MWRRSCASSSHIPDRVDVERLSMAVTNVDHAEHGAWITSGRGAGGLFG